MDIPTAVKALIFALLFCFVEATTSDQCCRKHQIPDYCAKILCNPNNLPDEFTVYELFDRRFNCSKHLNTIAQCLADGRNHTNCCVENSKFAEENACFGLCQGEGPVTLSWKSYQTCVAVNLPVMFSCFLKGYTNSPSPPQYLTASTERKQPVQLSWSVPLVNPEEAQYYQVVCVENDSSTDSRTEIVKETRSMSITLEDLQPATKYFCYVVAVARDGKRKSLASDKVHFQTTGTAPKMYAYKKNVTAPLHASSTILACRFEIKGDVYNRLTPVWYKKNDRDNYQQLRGDRYSISHYNSQRGRPRKYITILEISNLEADDFGMYRCDITFDAFRATSDVELLQAEVNGPDSTPPKTVYACCQDQSVSSQCISMCGSNEDQRQIPILKENCSSELVKVMTCAMPSIDDSGCCLKERVPQECMYLCDSSITPKSTLPAVCQEHLSTVAFCRYEGASKRPSIPKNIKVTPDGDSQYITWVAAERADQYHIYWRRQHSMWMHDNVTTTSRTVSGADEIVIVAANLNGISEPLKLTLVNGKWLRS